MGDWLGVFCKSVAYVDIILVELWAMKEGLSLAWDRGYRDLICETDCHHAFKLLHYPHFSKSNILDVVLFEIQGLLKRQWRV